MFKSFKKGKHQQKQSLLENDTSRKVVLDNWAPLSGAAQAQDPQRQQSLDDQRVHSMAVKKPQAMGQAWTSFKNTNPFEEDPSPPAGGSAPVPKKVSFPPQQKPVKVAPLLTHSPRIKRQPTNPAGEGQCQMKSQQPGQFSAANPFATPGAGPQNVFSRGAVPNPGAGFSAPASNPFGPSQSFGQPTQSFFQNSTSTTTSIHISQLTSAMPAAAPAQPEFKAPAHDPWSLNAPGVPGADPFVTPPGTNTQQPRQSAQQPSAARAASADMFSMFDPIVPGSAPPTIQRAESAPSAPITENNQQKSFETLFGDFFATPGGADKKSGEDEKVQDLPSESDLSDSGSEGKPKKTRKKKKKKSKSDTAPAKSKKRKKTRKKKTPSPPTTSEEEDESEDAESSKSTSSEAEGEGGNLAKAFKSENKKKKKGQNPTQERTESLAELFRGTAMLKFPRRGRGLPHFKWVQLTRSKTSIYLQWFSKKKSLKMTTVNIQDMDEVLQGKQSEVFTRFEQETLTPAAFSILYNREYSLDLVAKSVDECQMWVKCLKELIKRAKQGQDMSNLSKIWINGLKYIDRNRPMRALRGKAIVRANMVKDRRIKPRVQESVEADLVKMRKRCSKLVQAANSSQARASEEHPNILLSVNDLEDRLEELLTETRESMDSEISKRDVWRFGVDLGALEEKVKVVQGARNFYLHP